MKAESERTDTSLDWFSLIFNSWNVKYEEHVQYVWVNASTKATATQVILKFFIQK